jgi:hypothetical protein
MNMQLSELERTAYALGDTEKAEIIAQLIQAREALEKLTEAADSFATITEREAKNSPEFLESGYTIINTDSAEFTDLVNAITEAQEALED